MTDPLILHSAFQVIDWYSPALTADERKRRTDVAMWITDAYRANGEPMLRS